MVAFVFHVLKMNVIAAGIIGLVILIARLTKKKYSIKWKYNMWLVISLFLLFPVPFPGNSLIRLQIDRPETPRKMVVSAGNAGETAPALGGEPVPVLVGEQQKTQAAPKHFTIPIESEQIAFYGILQVFGMIWAAGIVICGSTKILRYIFSLRRLRRWSYPVEDERTKELYRWISMKKHIRRPPKLLRSPNLATPVLAGLREPALYLTEAEYDAEEVAFILSHELTHYKRRDLWYKMLLTGVTTIYWFNPALYRMCAEAEKDVENLCDGTVVEGYTRTEQVKYGRLLLKTAALQNHIPYLAASLNDSTLVFKERINYMINLDQRKKNVFLVLGLTLLLASGQVLVGSTVRNAAARADQPFTNGTAAAGSGAEAAGAEWQARESGGAGTGGIGAEGTGSAGVGITGAEGTGSAGVGITGAEGGSGAAEITGTASAGLAGADGAEMAGDSDSRNEEAAAERVLEKANFTVWVAGQQLNVRGGSSSEAPVIGTLFYADAVEVTGIEKAGGAETGWYQVNYNGSTGYIASAYVTTVPDTAETLGYTLTDERVTLYQGGGGAAAYVYRATDGNWYDGSGRPYRPDGSGQWTCLTGGSVWTETAPPSPGERAAAQVLVQDEEGLNSQTLYAGTDGSWRNGAGGIYSDNGDGTWTGPDGEIWYGI